jgi:CRP/FNR family cyclic AMP-dependent transcriptional regulator
MRSPEGAVTVAQLTKALADHPFLSEFSHPVLVELASQMRRREYPAGEVIFAEGAPAERFFLIRRGLVGLTMQLPDGGHVELETLGPDAALGWSWLLPPYCWHLTAVAHKRTSVFVFDAYRLRKLMESDPAVGYDLMQRFAAIIFDRLRVLHSRVGSDFDGSVGVGGQASRKTTSGW